MNAWQAQIGKLAPCVQSGVNPLTGCKVNAMTTLANCQSCAVPDQLHFPTANPQKLQPCKCSNRTSHDFPAGASPQSVPLAM